MGDDNDNSALVVVPNSSEAMIMHPGYAPVNIVMKTHTHLVVPSLIFSDALAHFIVIQTPSHPNN